ncbi:MAG: diadenylate cyclase CdaA [Prevotellaceae bacterium]|jgi:uncharacterized protein (TIGR00159 family)|nr:diadenylate cyclase CdaA [Prevotellaceae bacterium]
MDFISLSIIDIIDILITAFLAYQVYKLIRGTAAMNIFIGIILIYFVWLICRTLKMELLSLIIGQIIGVGVIALIIVFQPEIRRFLLLLGFRSQSKFSLSRLFIHSRKSVESTKVVDEVIKASRKMADSKIGALIVFAQKSPLADYAETGDIIDAIVNSRLLESIFFKNNPLHDGAVIVRNGRIVAARCVLPSTDNINLPAHYGMRHRAAIGVSEKTDAVVVIISEETGSISYCENGEMRYNISSAELRNLLIEKE